MYEFTSNMSPYTVYVYTLYSTVCFLWILLVIDHIQQPNYAILSPRSFTCQQEFLFLEVVWWRHTGKNEKERHLLMEEGSGGGAKSYYSEKPWSSINHSIPSGYLHRSQCTDVGMSIY